MARQISRVTRMRGGMKKDVLTKIDDTYYLASIQGRQNESAEWEKFYFSRADQQNDSDGSIKTRALHDVDKYFDLLIKYEKFTEEVSS